MQYGIAFLHALRYNYCASANVLWYSVSTSNNAPNNHIIRHGLHSTTRIYIGCGNVFQIINQHLWKCHPEQSINSKLGLPQHCTKVIQNCRRSDLDRDAALWRDVKGIEVVALQACPATVKILLWKSRVNVFDSASQAFDRLLKFVICWQRYKRPTLMVRKHFR